MQRSQSTVSRLASHLAISSLRKSRVISDIIIWKVELVPGAVQFQGYSRYILVTHWNRGIYVILNPRGPWAVASRAVARVLLRARGILNHVDPEGDSDLDYSTTLMHVYVYSNQCRYNYPLRKHNFCVAVARCRSICAIHRLLCASNRCIVCAPIYRSRNRATIDGLCSKQAACAINRTHVNQF